MIAYIDEPLRGTNRTNGHDILVVGLYDRGTPADLSVVYVDQDGDMGITPLSEVNINWRFDDRTRRWLDVDTGEELGDDDNGQ